MSESGDYIKQFEQLLKDEKFLIGQVTTLKNQVKNESEALAQIQHEKNSILKDIALKKEESLATVNEYKQSVERTLNKERIRLEAQAENQNVVEGEQTKERSKLKQELNELEDRKTKFFESLKEVKQLELDLKNKEIDLKKIKEKADLDNQTALNMFARAKQEKLNAENTWKDAEEINRINTEQKKNNEINKAKLYRAAVDLREKKEEEESIIKEKSKVLGEIQQKNVEMITLSKELKKRQKDLNDKEQALKAYQIEIDFKLAKLKQRPT